MKKKWWIAILLIVIGSVCSYIFIFNSKPNLEIPKEIQEKVKKSGSYDAYYISFYKKSDIKKSLPIIKKYVSYIDWIEEKEISVMTSEKYIEVLEKELGKQIYSIAKFTPMPEG